MRFTFVQEVVPFEVINLLVDGNLNKFADDTREVMGRYCEGDESSIAFLQRGYTVVAFHGLWKLFSFS